VAEPRPPAPPLDPHRIDALWQATAPKVSFAERRRRLRRGLALAAALPLIAGLGFWAGRAPSAEGLRAVGDQVASHSEPSRFTLRDGTVVEAGPDTAMTLSRLEEREIGLHLAQGQAHFEVKKRPERRFLVQVDDVTVTVVGTRFWVARRAEEVEVQVEEGVVEVEHQGQRSTLRAGQRWARPRHVTPPAAGAEPELDPAPIEAADPDPPAAEPAPGPQNPARADRPQPRSVGKAERKRAEADRLFEAALEARRSGDPQAALQAFRTLVQAHPNHPRVALSSFELGRLEMDVAKDLDAAVIALSRAVRAGQNTSFAEDALARLAQAQAGRGDRRGCQEARKLYAERYPAGSYAASLATVCP
jgi:TolA-binding protein